MQTKLIAIQVRENSPIHLDLNDSIECSDFSNHEDVTLHINSNSLNLNFDFSSYTQNNLDLWFIGENLGYTSHLPPPTVDNLKTGINYEKYGLIGIKKNENQISFKIIKNDVPNDLMGKIVPI
ncbi:MAG: hypothetical protein K2Y14_04235 [Burkholderiales bacterium]|nr:hypothetical protein [Burkholderiales bacterium]